MLPLHLRAVVLEAHVGHGNLSVDERKSVTLGDSFAHFFRLLFRCERGEFAVQIALQFVVENDAGDTSACCLDALGLRLVQAIEIGIVFCFAGLHEPVIDDLVFRDDARASRKPGSFLRQRE